MLALRLIFIVIYYLLFVKFGFIITTTIFINIYLGIKYILDKLDIYRIENNNMITNSDYYDNNNINVNYNVK